MFIGIIWGGNELNNMYITLAFRSRHVPNFQTLYAQQECRNIRNTTQCDGFHWNRHIMKILFN